MADILEINATTGEVIEREFTPEERAQRERDAADYAAAQEAAVAEQQRKEAARASAIAKLAALGLDADEVSAVIGGAV